MENGSTFEQALSTIYGVDLMPDNVNLCKERLLCGQKQYQHIVDKNIVCADGLKYDYLFGEADISVPLPGAIGDAVTSLISGSGITSASTLGLYGIQYVYFKWPVDSPIVRTIDGSGGFVRMSSTNVGVVWKISGARPHIYFVDSLNQITSVPSTDSGAAGDVVGIGEVVVTEKFFEGEWKTKEEEDEFINKHFY